MSDFDPYLKWLGIRKGSDPVDHYTLLGIERFESDREVISSAADRQMIHVRTFQTGERGIIAQKILNELARARRCLLTPEKKLAYDEGLIRESEERVETVQTEAIPAAKIVQEEAPVIKVDESDSGSPLLTGKVVTDSVDVGMNLESFSDTDNSRRHRSKKNNGTLWTIVGALGGGVSAIIASYFILTSMGIWEQEKVADNDSNVQPDETENGDDNNDHSSLTNNEDDWGKGTKELDGGRTENNSDGDNSGRNENDNNDDEKDPFKGHELTDNSDRGSNDSNRKENEGRRSDNQMRLIENKIKVRQERFATIAGRNATPSENDQEKLAQLKIEIEQLQLEYKKIAEGKGVDPDSNLTTPPSLASNGNMENPDGDGDGEADSEIPTGPPGRISSLSQAVAMSDIDWEAREAFPDSLTLKAAEGTIKDAFADELKEAKSSAAKALELSRKFLRDARATNDVDEQVGFYLQAIEMAKSVGDGQTASQALLELDETYRVDEYWRLVRKTIDSVSRRIQELPQAREFYLGINDLAHRAVLHEQTQELDYLFSKGLSVAKKMKNESAKDYYLHVRQFVSGIDSLIENNKLAEPRLAASPDDPVASQNRGDYLVYFQGDLIGGLEYWRKGNVAEVGGLIEQERKLVESDSTSNVMTTAEAWYESGAAYGSYQDHVKLLRARDLFKLAESKTRGLEQQRATLKVEEINRTLKRFFLATDGISLFSSKILLNEEITFVAVEEESQRRYRNGMSLVFSENNRVRVSAGNIREDVLYAETEADVFIIDGNRRQFAIELDTSKRPFRARLEIYDRRLSRLQETHLFTVGEE